MIRSTRSFLMASLLAVSVLVGQVSPVHAASLPAEINKQFTPLQIDAGAVSVMRVTIFNPNSFPLTDADWTDNLVGVQPGLYIANPAGVVNTCGGTVTATPGGTNLSLGGALINDGGNVPAQVGSTPGECYIEVNVSSVTPGNLINTIPASNLDAQGNDGGTPVNITNTTPASATITVTQVLNPSLSKLFVPSTIFVGENSQLTIRLNNNDSDTNLTGASYTDTLPAGLQIATPNGLTVTNCGPGTATALAGGTVISLSGATVTPAQDCLVRVNVTGASGAYLIANSTANTIPAGPGGPGSLQTNQGVTNTTPAQGEITIQPISVQKAFAPDPVDAGDTSILTITLENPTGAAYTGVAINDDLTTMGAGFTIGGAPTANTCGFTVNAPVAGTLIQLTGGTIPASATPPTPRGTCTFSIPVQTSLTSTGGTSANNTIPAGALTATQPVTNFLPATDNLTVNRALVGTKAYSPTSMLLGGTSQVTITLTNRSNTPITGVNFTDTLAANLTVSGTPLTPQCGGVISNAANSVTLTGGTIPANGTCTIIFNVTSSTAGTYDNAVAANSITNSQGIGHAGFSTDPDLVVINAATLPVGLTKAFQTDPIALGQPTRLRITITAPVDTNLTGLNITDNLPAGLVIVGTASTPPAPANPVDTCTGANVVAPINGTSISLTGASILAGANCTITVYVTATTPGLYTNTIPTGVGGITTIEGRTNINPASDTLTATGMTTSKAFYPAYVQAGGRSTVTLTLFNTSSIPMTNISVTDTMPGTATNGVRVAAVPNAITTCGGTLTAAPGSNIVTLTGGTIPAGSIATPSLCTITFDVVGLDSTPGTSSTQTNTLPAVDVDAFIGSTGVATNPVADSSATLNIQDLSMGVVKGFNPVLVYGGAYSTMSVELINPNLNAPLTGIAFTDDMTLLGTGMRLANPVTFDVGTCGGVLTGNPGDTSFSFSGGSLAPTTTCTLTLRVVMTVNGNLTNRIPAGTVTTFNGVSNPDPTEASLTNLPGVSVIKSFSPAQVLTNQPSTLTIIISNTSNVPVVNMGVADNLPGTLPDGLEVANPANETNTCGGTLTAVPGAQTIQLVGGGLTAVGTPGAICTLTVDVISTRPGVYVNTIPAGAITSTGGVTNNDPTTDTLTVTTNYSLGNRVWYDTNNNGLIDFGTEAGIPNVRVQLFNSAGTEINVGPDGILGNGDDAPGGMLTNATGYYRFDNLPAGDYTVRIPNDNFSVGGTTDALVGYWSSGTTVDISGVPSDATTNDPDTDVDDSDENGLTTLSGNATNFVASATVTVGPGSVEPLNESDLSGGQGATDGYANMTVDFGFYRQTLGDLVFIDVDGSGEFNAGDTPLQNALVQLYSSNGTEIITGADGIRGTADDGFGPDGISGNGDDGTGGVTTGSGGTYSFSGLPQGDYIVRVTPPAGYSSTVDTTAPADTTDPDTNTDNNDNGSGTGTGQVSSGVITLTPGQGTGGSAGAANNVVTQNSGTTSDPTVDFGFTASNYSLGNRVWYDTNNNGLIDFGTEAGIPNVRVQLFDSAGTEINVGPDGILGNGDDAPGGMLTNATGYYRFDNLPAGDYTVRIPNDNFTGGGTTDALVGYWSSGTTVNVSGVPSDSTSNDPDTDVDDSDENGISTLTGNATNFVASATVTLGPGSVEPLNESDLSGGQGAVDGNANMTVDFGFYRQTLGDLVFVDVNENGTYDAGDIPLQNAVVQLYSSNGTEIITGADGIRGTADDGFGPDGISGNGDDGTGGMLTNAGGNYIFGGLPQGDYIVRVTPPVGYSSTVDTSAPADTTDPDTNTDNNDNGSGTGTGQVSSGVVTLTPGQGTGGSAGAANNIVTQVSGTTSDPTVDFGFITPGYSLGNRVWFDTDNSSTINGTEVGIDGVRVNLYLDDGTTPGVYDAGDTFVDFDTTAAGGYYRFDNLAANDYVVVIPAENFRNVGVGDTVSGDPLSGYFSSGSTINVAGAVSDSTANDPDTTATDSDENGISTLTGNTINYVASSAVTLGPGASEPSGETDLSGGQGATDLRANMTVDFGFYRTEIGNLVFSDVNGDGDYDAGIDGLISGAQVQLYSSNGTEINVGLDGILGTSDDAAGGVTTGVGGTYLFSGLPQGDYIVRVNPPAGTSTVDTAAPVDTTDPDTNTDNNDNGSGTGAGQVSSGILTMTPGQGTGGSAGAANNVVTNGTGSTTDPTVDFGFTPLYSLGNRVWYDTNNNGLIDFGTESGINGVRVNLYLDNGTTPGVYDAGDTFVVSDITASGGYYRFDSLNAGNYVITIPADNFRNVGVGDTIAGDPLAGYWSSGSTISAAGVVSDSTTNDPDTTVTDSDENGISTLAGNSTNYVASAAVTLGPSGSEPSGETDLSGGQGAADTYANMTVDFGFYRQTLGDLVFVDNNTNGTYDAGDTPLQNAVVQLYSSTGVEINIGPDGILGTSDDAAGGVTTGAGGTYSFSGLPQGDYIVRVTPPVGYSSTVDTADAADTTDPDTNADNNDNGAGIGVGQVSSNPVTLTPGSAGALSNNTVNNNTGVTTNPTVDFGFVGNNGAVTKTMTGTNETFTTGTDVAIGEIVTYQVVVNLPVGIPLTNVTVTDQMDKGLAFVDCVLVEVAGVNQTATACPPAVSSITNPGDLPGNPANPGRQIVFTLGNIAAQPAAATIRIQYRAIVLDVVENQQGVALNNSVTWAFTGGSFTTSVPNVNIIEPDLSIDKSAIPNSGVAIGTPIQFSLTINHTTFSSVDAFDVVVTDILPPELEYIPCSITYTGLAPTTPVAPAYCPGAASNLIFEWDVFPLGATATITFNARLINTPAANTASIAWTSLPIDPGPGGLPVQLSTHNAESTERWYDPLDDVNVYAVFDTVAINAPPAGGGGNDDDEDSSLPNTLPKTGFAPNRVTLLPAQPAEKAYSASEVWLEVPRLGLTMPIVGVPIVGEDWDVSWLWNEAGWLEGTAFPGWEGNSVLTSHVTLSNGADGPFAKLGNLKYGDRIIVHAYGSLYIYEVRQNRTISPYNTTVLQHEDDAWITLLTCATYNEDTNTYSNRIAVRAVLISVTEDKTNSAASNIR